MYFARRLLVVEDDRELRGALRGLLLDTGYGVDVCSDGRSAVHALASNDYDLALIDLTLPDMDGLALVHSIRRARKPMAIVIVTGRCGIEERVAGLDGGADDYVVKPFEIRELEARIRVLLRPPWERTARLSFGPLSVMPGNPQIWLDGNAVTVRPGELALLELLLAKAGRVVSKTTLAQALARGERARSEVAIEICVHRVRRQLEPYGLGIRSLRGFGYMLVDNRPPGALGAP
jgi:two-component system OmpR family response regulator